MFGNYTYVIKLILLRMCTHVYQYYSVLESVDVKLVPMILMLIQCIVIKIVYIYKVIHMNGLGVQKCQYAI